MLAILGAIVIVATSLALMVPVISVTADVATQERGFFTEPRAAVGDRVAASATGRADQVPSDSAGVQATGGSGGESSNKHDVQATGDLGRESSGKTGAQVVSDPGRKSSGKAGVQVAGDSGGKPSGKVGVQAVGDSDSAHSGSSHDSNGGSSHSTDSGSSSSGASQGTSDSDGEGDSGASGGADSGDDGDGGDGHGDAGDDGDGDDDGSSGDGNDGNGDDGSGDGNGDADDDGQEGDGSDESASSDASDTGDDSGSSESADPSSSSGSADKAVPMPAQSFKEDIKDSHGDVIVAVSVEAPKGAFPEGTTMKIAGIGDAAVRTLVEEAIQKDESLSGEIQGMLAVDISFFDSEGNPVEPAKNVNVKITSPEILLLENPVLMHVVDKDKDKAKDKDGKSGTSANLDDAKSGSSADKKTPVPQEAEVVKDCKVIYEDESRRIVGAENTMKFTTKEFSPYVIVGIEIITIQVITADGEMYAISATYDQDAGIPDNSQLEVTELTGEDHDDYVGRTAASMEAGGFDYARVFDISIVDPEGNYVTPATQVDVSVQLLDAEGNSGDFSVVHFRGESQRPEQMRCETDGNVVSFSTSSFSAYAIVQGPDTIPLGWTRLATMDDLRSLALDGLYIGTTGGYYCTNETAPSTKDGVMGIVKTTPVQSSPPEDRAAKYYFEPVAGTNNQFYIYCLSDGGDKQYVNNTGDAELTFVDEADKTAFTAQVDNQGRFRFNNGNRYWNMWSGANGNNIAAWTTAGDSNNYFYLYDRDASYEGDPYGLDGNTYGLLNWTEGTVGKAMMAESSSANYLDALPLTVMAKAGEEYNDKLFLPDNSDDLIAMWTFTWLGEGDKYYVTTEVDGAKKYLRVHSNGLTLVDSPDANCQLQVVPGSGTNAGAICLKAGNVSLTYSGNYEQGFKTRGAAGTEWLRLAEISDLTEDYFMTYSAQKVSVSDEAVENGSRIIVYTRAWNDEKKRYEFYAVDHDGNLVPCYETGDSIEWVGSRYNTLLWNFVEYYWEDTNDPNYYYELYNQYSQLYVAPQVSGGQILSDSPIGINLNGRREGAYYTTVLAWDDDNYSYVGLKADVANGRIVSCPKGEADDFYFAIMQDIPIDDKLITVPTVDNTTHGITMRIVDIKDRATMKSFLGSNDVYGKGNTESGLLTTNLDEAGYPTTKAGNSLADWFAGGDAREVNHLFIGSTYSGTGYYEYDSTQNFAHLNNDNTFSVYKQIGTIDVAMSGNERFMQHGQFMPFNDIAAGTFSSLHPHNLTDPLGAELPSSDPRKHEELYLIKNQNYQFGMQIEASFTQTPDGKDDWGHDIIYEFTGDDDFWLYVDGELVIDLGGIHDALPGTVNFRTGEVTVNGVETSLYELFRKNYIDRGMSAAEIDAKLAEIFRESDEFPGQYIFKDYTTHTMNIFYLERGAGASNLHMRFNLASVKPGTVQLDKRLAGVESTESVLAEFPYQIYYKTEGSDVEHRLTNSMPGSAQVTDYVFYKDTITPVKYRQSVTIDGVTYPDVFMLKPNEVAEINFPDGAAQYRIVECGVNTTVYRSVKANGEEIAGEPTAADNRKDYGIGYATTKDRARVTYVNEADPDAVRDLTFTKRLYDETGDTEITDDPSTFSFRLYLATEFDGELDENPAYMHTYHVKNAQGVYCRWDSAQQAFVPLGDGATDFTELSPEDKTAASFTTSVNGAISRIPIGYTVEVRDVLAGTQFKLVERPSEIPDGYSFQKYTYQGTDYAGDDSVAYAGVADTVASRAVSPTDPHIDVCNLKGWGLRVNKVWTDKAYMSSRDPIYFAVFTDDGAGHLSLVDNTLRQMAYAENTLYWYFLPLPVPGTTFAQYKIYEVTLEDPVVGEDGYVTSYGSMAIVDDEGEDNKVTLSGTQKGETEPASFTYTVQYERGRVSQGSNVRVDTVTNDRPGIVIQKTDWAGEPLPGATFTLAEGDDVIGTFTSESDGRVTVAFLGEDKEYTLTETKAPAGYHGLEGPLTITVSSDHSVTVSGVSADEGCYRLTESEGDLQTLVVKNRPFELAAVKMGVKADGTPEPLPGATFALYRAVHTGDTQGPDTEPLAGCDALVSAEETGVIPNVDQSLQTAFPQVKTYYLRETSVPSGYLSLPGDVKFTISETGMVTLDNVPSISYATLSSTIDEGSGALRYTIEVDNRKAAALVRIIKVDQGHNALEGGSFTFAGNGISQTGPAQKPEGKDYALIYENAALPLGDYTLTETAAPDGYNALGAPMAIHVANDGNNVSVTASIGQDSLRPPDIVFDQSTGQWTISVVNHAGVELPNTGGPGTMALTVFGVALVALAGVTLALGRRKRLA